MTDYSAEAVRLLRLAEEAVALELYQREQAILEVAREYISLATFTDN